MPAIAACKYSCHTAKGVAGMYNFIRAFNLIEGIEKSAANSSVETTQVLSSSLLQHINQIRKETAGVKNVH